MKLQDKPFWFGAAAEDQYFTDRKEDTTRLVSNFTYGINTILVSPRRWGKTSLVLKCCKIINESNPIIKVVKIDIFSCRTAQDFCEMFAAALIKQTSSKFEEWMAYGRKLLSRLNPVFSFGADPSNDFSVKFDFNSKIDDIDYVLNLPEKIAQEKNIRIMVCIDEFQQIGEFDNSLSFQKRLRGVWQLQQRANYCLFGSKRHMMLSLFSSPSNPFYKFGDIIDLQRIPTKYWVEYIRQRFASTDKHIDEQLAEKICLIVQNNSSYVQQLSWYVWNATTHTVDDESLRTGFSMLMAQNIALFEKQTEDLSTTQYNYLVAMSHGISSGFSKEDIIRRFDLKNSASVRAAQKALEKKELIFIKDKVSSFNDPLLPIWLRVRSLPSLDPYETDWSKVLHNYFKII